LINPTDTKECRGKFFVVNEKWLPADRFDIRILQSGTSFYEVLKVRGKIPLFMDDHLERLAHSIKDSHVTHCPPLTVIKKNLEILIYRNNSIPEGNVRLILHFPESVHEKPDILCYYTYHRYPSAEEYDTGVPLVLIHAQREKVHSKIIDLNFRMSLNQIIMDTNAYEGLLVDSEGFITEGSKSNFFMIGGSGLVTAPEKYVLPGITRKNVFRISRNSGINIIERKIHITEIGNFDSCFISGTSPGILAVSNIGPNRYNRDHPLLDKISKDYEKQKHVICQLSSFICHFMVVRKKRP
jgi:branched-chain amino acid aminotransferase